MDMAEKEQRLYDEGYRVCGLCNQWCVPVTDHNDCYICATAQYGD